MDGGAYFLPPALFLLLLLLSVEVPVPPAAACCAFLAAFSSSAFLSLARKIRPSGKRIGAGSAPSNRDLEKDRIESNRRK